MKSDLRGRYELKFLVTPEGRDEILNRMGDALVPDSNGDNGIYAIRSLYYDTKCQKAYYEKLDGLARRHKFRLRYYGKEAPQTGFFEIKSRYDRLISKVRIPLSTSEFESILASPDALLELDPPKTESLRLGLEFIRRTHLAEALIPSVVTSYTREAYFCSYDPTVRVTLDHSCEGLNPGRFPQKATESGLPLCHRDHMIPVSYTHLTLPTICSV